VTAKDWKGGTYRDEPGGTKLAGVAEAGVQDGAITQRRAGKIGVSDRWVRKLLWRLRVRREKQYRLLRAILRQPYPAESDKRARSPNPATPNFLVAVKSCAGFPKPPTRDILLARFCDITHAGCWIISRDFVRGGR
jgi:hypothetical protein